MGSDLLKMCEKQGVKFLMEISYEMKCVIQFSLWCIMFSRCVRMEILLTFR